MRPAVVQASLVARERMGDERACHPLRREGLPDDGLQRVLRGAAGAVATW